MTRRPNDFIDPRRLEIDPEMVTRWEAITEFHDWFEANFGPDEDLELNAGHLLRAWLAARGIKE